MVRTAHPTRLRFTPDIQWWAEPTLRDYPEKLPTPASGTKTSQIT